ncbi:MAG: hypothetical protein GQ574_02025 [Crocinitomix sp.]|nr:hypothetical protein [Crocinitomix sp.]
MNQEKKSYQFRLNISVILTAILLGALVISTFTEYSELAGNQTHIVDCEDDSDSEESEIKDLSHRHSNVDPFLIAYSVNMITLSIDLIEIRYGEIPTPPPEL